MLLLHWAADVPVINEGAEFPLPPTGAWVSPLEMQTNHSYWCQYWATYSLTHLSIRSESITLWICFICAIKIWIDKTACLNCVPPSSDIPNIQVWFLWTTGASSSPIRTEETWSCPTELTLNDHDLHDWEHTGNIPFLFFQSKKTLIFCLQVFLLTLNLSATLFDL